MEWTFDGRPDADAPGWYAVLICFDAEEGVFPTAAKWDGLRWNEKSVVAFGERRDTADEAIDLAYDNDPDNPMTNER